MRVRLLGPVDVVDAAGRTVAIGSPTQRLLLAVLGSRAGDVVPVGRLAEAVWGDLPPPSAEATLRSYISRLRRVLGDALPTRPGGWSLCLAPEQVDITVFESLLELSRRVPDAAERLALLDDALALWRGPPFGDLAEHPALRPVATRLAQARGTARESRAVLGRAGRPRTGPSADADPAGRPVRAALQPRAETPPGTGRQPRRPRRPGTAPLGRAADLAAVEDLIGAARLVTLFGPEGVGRTRLALRLADRLAERFAAGVRLIELAAVSDPADVAARTADGCGAGGTDGDLTAALAAAAELDALVILDGCDQVAAGAAAVAAALVGGGRGARVLVTGREPLGVAGERCWPVRPLRVDGPDAPALALFWDRVRAARPDRGSDGESDGGLGGGFGGGFVRGPGGGLRAVDGTVDRAADWAAAERIVRRLDGLPLGIEIAAARSDAIPLAELADRLDELLSPHRAGRRRGPAPRALEGVVGWSVSMLDPPHRAMLRTLGVFAGPAAAADVAALAETTEAKARDILDALAARALAARALVAVAADPAQAPVRYALPWTARDYARRRLGASEPGLARAHARHVLAELRAADALLRTPREAEGHRRLEDLLAEALAAQRWTLLNDPPRAVEITAALYVYARSRRQIEPLCAGVGLVRAFGLHPPAGTEPHRLADLVSDLSVEPPPGVSAGALATALATAAAWYVGRGDLEMAGACAQRGRLVAGDAPERGFVLELLSDIASRRGRTGEAVDHGWELVAAARACGDRHAEVAGIVSIVTAHAHAGDAEAGRVALTQVPDAALAPSDLGWLAYGEAELVLDRDPERGLRLLERAAALADSVGNSRLGAAARAAEASARARGGEAARPA
ncbi:BTAD domain-containing putative transcriptional regulator [Frankia sp. EI5c]|uniref:BTAD domain-containing putative transcriptional regulator n=1 Tax=Frankia sp. EI5c TaxID=683316 RepID=UPI001F5B331B|nr:BTAD domain-containing putative transcriptional regulator [Frankia sp. EI5c]